MKVFQVCAYAAPYEGNFIKSLKALQTELEKRSIETIYAFPESAKEIQWCQELALNSKVYFLPLSKASIRPATRLTLKEIYKQNPDIGIVHSHFELYDIPVVLTAPKSVKVFWHLHDAIQIYDDLKNKLLHKLQYGFLHKRAVLLSVSEKHRDYVLSLGFPEENAFFVPNGLDLDRIDKIDIDLSKRRFDFIIFGWDYTIKGIDLCIEAFKKINSNAKLGIVGTETTKEKIVEEFGDIEGVEVIAPQDNINAVYSQTKSFLLLSRAEGLSYSLLEAVFAGLPVICSDIKENLFAEKFQTVTMVKSEDVDSIFSAMQKQILNPSPDDVNVENARSIIKNEYSIDNWVKTVLEFYEVKQ